MATATTTRNLGKTGFVKEVLNDNPQANTKAVNEAWRAAGFEGTIGPTLVTKMRSRLGLTGNSRKGPGKKAEAEAAPRPTGKKRGRRKRATGPGRGGNQGKTAFVIEHLRRNPNATDDEINEAWASAGNEGHISGSLLYKLRAKEGLTRRRGARGRGVEKRGRARSSSMGTRVGRTAEPAVGTPVPLDGRTSRGRSIAEVESDIDRLIFKLIAVGGMETIEDELRKVRRLLYRNYSG
jgi:hypothetical protein